ncbi:YfhO family protein [Nocardioides sp. YIM 152315]|uniref:YfhO family protein n=1 Tax=Nocardioides sp. YIM 152315 TaxID=3031760 RepID=UPI0023DA7E00|nr:YfhO family protein [Nocardioides sp. YIM 152315]MDF1604304.1 YfhO family protein [Nocardioides sp. YIM 152315]
MPTADTSRRRSPRADWLRRVGVGAYFAAATLAFGWPALLGRASSVVPSMQARLWPWRGDLDPSTLPPLGLQLDGAVSSYPWSQTFHEAIRHLELPFWDWHSFLGGYDLASNGVAGAFYPVHWVVWMLFDPLTGHTAYMLLHLWLGGLAMYLLLRHWHLGGPAGLVGGTCWMMCSYNVAWLQAEMMTPILVVTPLVFWALSAVVKQPDWPRVMVGSAAVALALVAGNIVVFLVVLWVAGLAAALRAALQAASSRDWRAVLRPWGALVGVGLGGLALSAVVTLPTLHNLLTLGRVTASRAESLPPRVALDDVAAQWWSAPPAESSLVLFSLFWCGRVALVLAAIGLSRRGRLRWMALALVLLFGALPYVPELVTLSWFTIPPVRAVSGFGRLAFLAAFGLAILAALGTSQLARIVSSRAGARPRASTARWALGLALGVLVVAEMIPFARASNPPWKSYSAASLYPATEIHQALAEFDRTSPWPALVLPISGVGDPQVPFSGNSFWGATAHSGDIDSVGGYDSAVPRRAAAVTRLMQGTPAAEAWKPYGGALLPTFSPEWSRIDLAGQLGITHLYTPPDVDLSVSAYSGANAQLRRVVSGPHGTLWRVDGTSRGPRLVDDAVLVPGPGDALARVATHDPQSSATVVLESRDGDEAPPKAPPAAADSPGSVHETLRETNSAHVEVTAERAAWLVMPIGFADGWHAEIDGHPTSVRPADFAYSAVRVPEGDHRVTFSYRPPLQVPGLVLTCAWVAFATGLLIRSGIRRRSLPAEQESHAART